MNKATIFAANGQVTAISFPGEAMNFNGIAVQEVEASPDEFEAALLAVAPVGVGSPWPPMKEAPVKPPKPAKAPKAE
jgi:hypothetical protein